MTCPQFSRPLPSNENITSPWLVCELRVPSLLTITFCPGVSGSSQTFDSLAHEP